MDWLPIESAPQDGSKVWVKRVHDGRIVSEGWAVFGLPHERAPMRDSIGVDPLGRLSASNYQREDEQRREFVSQKRWLKTDLMYCFPTPTHWSPNKPATPADGRGE